MFRRRASEGKTESAVPDGGEQADHDTQESRGTRQAEPDAERRPAEPDAGRRPAEPDAGNPDRDSAEPWGPPPAGLDVSMPHPARVWNYWLGGRDFFAADKVAGALRRGQFGVEIGRLLGGSGGAEDGG